MMNTKIADFVSKRTDPYFFSSQEDAKLTDIHTEVKRSIESATDELTFDWDPLLMAQAEEVLAAKGWTLEEATVLFLYWLAVPPEKAKAWNDQCSNSSPLQIGSLGPDQCLERPYRLAQQESGKQPFLLLIIG